MNITITGRRMEMSSNLKDYATKKIKKVEKYFDQLIDAHLIMYIDKLDHTAEIIINGDGVQFYGIEKAGDMYSAIDLLVDKMESQIVRYKEKHSGHKAVSVGKAETMEIEDRGGENIILNQVSNKPLDDIEAYLEMKMEQRDFIVFKKGSRDLKKDAIDYLNKNYAVIFKDNGGYKMVEIPFDMIRENRYDSKGFAVYDLVVHDDSIANPKIDFNSNSSTAVQRMSLEDAVRTIQGSNSPFIPFFNSETNYFNVIYRNGKKYEVMVPAF